ncbi:site-2 protease family protein [Patescibacteria group bacterium]|nr:site-2 protease family protein [Patescibacteria group bacterium]
MFVFITIIGLSVLVFFHEFGHFFAAKSLKIKVEEFGIGYPPRFFGIIIKSFKKRKFKFFWGNKEPVQSKQRTIYSLNWIPFGGFTKLKGEIRGDASRDSFSAQVWWKKAVVAFAGAGMNIILAIVLFSFLFSTGITQDIGFLEANAKIKKVIGVQIGMISPDSPANMAGLKIGDVITNIDGNKFNKVEDVRNYIKASLGQEIHISIDRKNSETTGIKLIPLPFKDVYNHDVKEEGIDEHGGVIGISLSNAVIVSYPFWQSLFMGIKFSVVLLLSIFNGIWLLLKTLLVDGKVIGGVMGPVGITSITASVAQAGYIYFLQFLGLLSVAIGAFQLIPFPALDGFKILTSVIEGVIRRPIKPKVEETLIRGGFFLLLCLLFYITIKEIISLF